MGAIVAIVLTLATILIAFNTIRLTIYTARNEISVMNIVGASRWYVRGPFMIAGVLYGVVSGVIVLIFLYPITLSVSPALEKFLGTFNAFSYYTDSFPLLFLVVIGSESRLALYQVISQLGGICVRDITI